MANGANAKLHKDLLLACGWGKEIDVVLLLQQGASVKVQDQVCICDLRLLSSLAPCYQEGRRWWRLVYKELDLVSLKGYLLCFPVFSRMSLLLLD